MWQEVCTDEKGVPDCSQNAKKKKGNVQEVEAGTGDLGAKSRPYLSKRKTGKMACC